MGSPVEQTNSIDSARGRLLRVEKTMWRARWVAAIFALFQIFAFPEPYPAGYETTALAILGLFVACNFAVRVASKRAQTNRRVDAISIMSASLDLAFISALLFIYTFGSSSSIWALLYLAPISGAIRFQLRGAVAATGIVSVLYVFREIFGYYEYDKDFVVAVILFRLGIAWMLAWATGRITSTLVRESAATVEVNQNLARMNDTMNQFVAVTSHEMRTPISVINGMSNLLRNRWTETTDAERQQMIEAIARQADSLDGLVEDLLASSQIDAGTLRPYFEVVKAGPIIEQCITEMQIAGIDSGIDDELSISIDKNHLKRTVYNLLTNAQKYGKTPYTVSFKRDSYDALLIVGDSGNGVSDDFVPRLFDRFARAAESQNMPGTGLGLSIVRGLVEANNGSIIYGRGQNGGAQFTIRYRGVVVPSIATETPAEVTK